MLKYMIYQNRKQSVGESLDYKLPSDGGFIWIYLENPSQDEINKVSKDFKLNKKHFAKYTSETRAVRYSFVPLSLVIVDYYIENKKVKTTHILFILKENCLITVVPEKSTYHQTLFLDITNKFEHKKRKEISQLLTEFLYEDAQENYDVLEGINEELLKMEETIVYGAALATKEIQRIFLLKRTLFKMGRRFWGSAKLVFTLRKGLTPVKFGKEASNMLDDIYDTYVHQIDILSSEREMLSDTLTMYTTNISNQLAKTSNELNIIMKTLTALTVILMIPTLISGIYGMNVVSLPAAQKIYGFYLLLLIMIGVMSLTYLGFKRKQWV